MALRFLPTTVRLLALGTLLVTATIASACGNACGEGSRCFLDGQCVRLVQEGEPCVPGGCAAGLWCPPSSSRCARPTVLGPDCDPDGDPSACGDGWCDILTRRCSSLPAVDDDCTIDGRCGIDSFCFEGRCTTYPGERAPCLVTKGQACALGLYCEGQICVRTEGGWCPLLEPPPPL
ncbi:MAG: hypothetical protein QM820_27465 [Minicystis sp.]